MRTIGALQRRERALGGGGADLMHNAQCTILARRWAPERGYCRYAWKGGRTGNGIDVSAWKRRLGHAPEGRVAAPDRHR